MLPFFPLPRSLPSTAPPATGEHYVVEEFHPDLRGGGCEGSGGIDVGRTWGRVAAQVLVSYPKGGSVAPKHLGQHLAHGELHTVRASVGHHDGREHPVSRTAYDNEDSFGTSPSKQRFNAPDEIF